MYSGILIVATSLGLALGSWLAPLAGLAMFLILARRTRIEETYGFFFEAKNFFADWRPELIAEHLLVGAFGSDGVAVQARDSGGGEFLA